MSSKAAATVSVSRNNSKEELNELLRVHEIKDLPDKDFAIMSEPEEASELFLYYFMSFRTTSGNFIIFQGRDLNLKKQSLILISNTWIISFSSKVQFVIIMSELFSIIRIAPLLLL